MSSKELAGLDDFIRKRYNNVIETNKSIDDIVLDYFFPNLNVGFLICTKTKLLDGKQLLDLTEKAASSGTKLIIIWEDQWYSKPKVLQSRILSIFGVTKRIHGRKTKVCKLDKPTLLSFLDENHLQVPLNGKYKYGLTLEGELIAVMSFSRGRQIPRDGVPFQSYEMVRYCNKLGCTVVGGMSKLLKHFVKEVNPDDVMSYADRDWSDGNAYEQLGFELEDVLPPIYFWVDPESNTRYYPHLLPVSIPNEGDEERLMAQHGYYKVWNTGSMKYLLLLKSI
ncbi:hypothetical protein V6R21_17050 [Limibacter armeniacum]|uniref:hypothetical protein n=1 Tax=Limibacter armeniacum TaxID=466084 RepID=UPI002FE5872C